MGPWDRQAVPATNSKYNNVDNRHACCVPVTGTPLESDLLYDAIQNSTQTPTEEHRFGV